MASSNVHAAIYANTSMNQGQENENIYNEIDDANRMNEGQESENTYNQIYDIANQSVIATNRVSVTTVGESTINEAGASSTTSTCSHVRKLKTSTIISAIIGLISILSLILLTIWSVWLFKPNRNTDESDQRHAHAPILTTFEAFTPDISTLMGDCDDVYWAGWTDSGVYNITLQGQMVPVYCHMVGGEGWTVFHNRMDGSVDFYNTWEEYKVGFGDLKGEFWWGNDHLATITATKSYTLRVDMSDWDGQTAYALYTNFRVAAESDNYRLTAEGYRGTAHHDALDYHSNGWVFSTSDRDNDEWRRGECAKLKHGGGWFRDCANANPNGRYGARGDNGPDVMYWWYWRFYVTSLKTMSMKIRLTDF